MSLRSVGLSNNSAILLVISVAAGLITSACRAQAPEFAPRVVIPSAFPAIEDAPVVSAAEATEFLADDELVLGVVVEKSARAYPINMLTGPQREIINDTLGGRSIAATW